MAVAYSQDLRDRVLAAYDRGMETKQIAETFGVSRAWARAVKQRRRETGETSARPAGGLRVVKIDLVRLAELVNEQPDATTAELHDRLGIQCSQSAVGMALRRLKLSFKKRQSMLQSRTARTWQNGERSGSLANVNATHVV